MCGGGVGGEGREEGRGGCLRRLGISGSGGTEGGQLKQGGYEGRFSKKLLDHFQIKWLVAALCNILNVCFKKIQDRVCFNAR